MERRLAAILATDMAGYSRLMEADETGTINRQKAHRRELIDPEIQRNRGNIIKTTGDGLLVEFASASDAVRAAIDIQNGMMKREQERAEDERICYRVGINVGDVVFDDDDIFGDGVNVASRLEGLAKPGGVCLSDSIYQMVQDSLNEPFNDLGTQKVKNISRAIRVWQWTPDTPAREVANIEHARTQRVQFCVTSDGVQLAYARFGKGPPILKAPNWLSHLDYEWRSPIWGPLFEGLTKNNQLVRFDHRGGGLSDWEVENISFDSMVADMAAVADAANLDRFAAFGISQGCAFSIRYAVENPDRVKCLILLGGYARGQLKRNEPDAEQLFEASQTFLERGWGSTNPVYRQMFAANFMPDATPRQKHGIDELQRVSISAENAIRIGEVTAGVDISELAKEVTVPTLILHTEGDQISPQNEGRRLAALIPEAQFVSLEGSNHVLVEGTPAFELFFREVGAFLKEHDS